MKTSKATTKILAIAATLIIATTLIIAPALTALAANSSPHPVPPIRTGPMWIVYNENNYNKLVYLFPNEEYHQRYLDQFVRSLSKKKQQTMKRAGYTDESFVCYKGDVLRPGDFIPDSVVYTDIAAADTILSDAARQAMYDAEAEIKAAGNHMEKLNPQVASEAQKKGFETDDCASVALFDLTYYFVNPEFNVSHDFKYLHASLTRKDLGDNFVCLLHRQNGSWSVVQNATLVNNTLTFEVSDLSPFALVVANYGSIMDSGAKQAPKTGDNTLTWAATAIGGLMLLLGAGYVLIRKKNA